MMTARYPLRYGLVAEIVASDDDRPVPQITPPQLKYGEHPVYCPCPKCAEKRARP